MEEENVVRVQQIDEIIDWFTDVLDENGNTIYGSSEIEEKFKDAGWDGTGRVVLANLDEDLSDYKTPFRKTAWFAKCDYDGISFLGFIEPVPKAIETYCDGFRFRSRLEARWYIAFKTWNADLVYEPEGYDLGDGILYLPDFLIHNVIVICHPDDYPKDWGDPFSPKDIYFEVKGNMTEKDSEKIRRFCDAGNRIFPVGDIPNGTTLKNIAEDISNQSGKMVYKNTWGIGKDLVIPFCGGYCGVDTCELIPCALKNPKPHFGLVDPMYDDCWKRVDIKKTLEGYNLARQARFEHGEHGFTN